MQVKQMQAIGATSQGSTTGQTHNHFSLRIRSLLLSLVPETFNRIVGFVFIAAAKMESRLW